jgi:hypothetical protein
MYSDTNQSYPKRAGSFPKVRYFMNSMEKIKIDQSRLLAYPSNVSFSTVLTVGDR